MQTGDQRGEVFFTGGNAVEEDDVRTAFFQAVLHGARQAFAVLLFIMNDGNTRWLNGVEDVFGGGGALRGVQTGGTHNVLVAALGQLRVSCARGDHQNAFVFVNIRRGLRGR